MRAKQPVSINGIEFDALINQSESYEAQVPAYPVESGHEVVDDIITSSLVLSMTLYLTDTPVSWRNRHQETGRIEMVEARLRELFFERQPVTVTTTDATYEDMAITAITFSKSAEVGYAREIPITMAQISVTETQTTTIPDSYGKSGSTKSSAGPANTSSGSSGSGTSGSKGSSGNASGSDKSDGGGSILYNLANSMGLLP